MIKMGRLRRRARLEGKTYLALRSSPVGLCKCQVCGLTDLSSSWLIPFALSSAGPGTLTSHQRCDTNVFRLVMAESNDCVWSALSVYG